MSNADGSFSGVPMVLLNSSSFKNFKSILLKSRKSSCNIFNLDKHQQMRVLIRPTWEVLCIVD